MRFSKARARRVVRRSTLRPALERLEDRVVPTTSAVVTFGGNAQHTSIYQPAAQNLSTIRWQTPVDLDPQYSGTDLNIHYGAPLITSANTVLVPVKTGATNGFEVNAYNGTTGAAMYSLTTDYILPSHDWTPSYSPALAISSLRHAPVLRRGRRHRLLHQQSRFQHPGHSGPTGLLHQPVQLPGQCRRLQLHGLHRHTAHQRQQRRHLLRLPRPGHGPCSPEYHPERLRSHRPQRQRHLCPGRQRRRRRQHRLGLAQRRPRPEQRRQHPVRAREIRQHRLLRLPARPGQHHPGHEIQGVFE